MKKSMFKFFLLSFILFAINSHAGILLEPYLGYALLGDGEVTVSNTKYENEYSTPTFGGRLGLQHLGFMMGVDYSIQNFEMESKTGSTTYEDDVKKKQLGIFVGYNFPVMFRIWGTYFLSSSFEGDDTVAATNRYDANDELTDGSGFALGIGYRPISYVSLNLEYRKFEYDTWEQGGVEATNITKDQKLSEILLSVSLPFNVL
ncbi:MAG: hypothetical protein A2381_16940 [Bdellovibrionales bacterium RIFOXYB1_FULL_37_110]|nr:MAG: hypothetical protein A2181_07945 [Bdellovibrionales bacterium RIFOXYA1_FULL_38_20]OFZ50085.1 MAG: hypothetical protein A2417_18775 [Bdellovibrionales bacterium RIFOXYC1_FULL_37_79]OFZ59991.1 MAG: hypothetical protein A2381_16940 [Bdellovibrionales bacterium RIFOXYB1_FULL_37_110]OFZ64286.1 MAG: hypothetical protein A2577_12715 [Bdellovibrionales bacterium RIFOXYD1_FULL_36_51]